MKQALVVIDVQNVMFTEEASVFQGKEVVNKIKLLIDKSRMAHVPIIYVQHVVDDHTKPTDTGGIWAICSEIRPLATDQIIQKRTCDAFHETTLDNALKALGVDQVVYVGMQTQFCVDTTCRRSFSMGYDGILIEDAHTTFDTELLKAEKIIAHHNSIMNGRFVKTIRFDDFEFLT